MTIKGQFHTIDDDAVSKPVVEQVSPNINKRFLLAGQAFFVVTNPTGASYQFKVHRRGTGTTAAYFVRDAANELVGVLTDTGEIKKTGRSKPGSEIEFDVAQWACRIVLNEGTIPAGYTIKHVGRCGVCGQHGVTPATGLHDDCDVSNGVS